MIKPIENKRRVDGTRVKCNKKFLFHERHILVLFFIIIIAYRWTLAKTGKCLNVKNKLFI